MEKTKLVPYTLYIHQEHLEKLKKLSEDRKASSMIRDSISMLLDGDTSYLSGYNRALKDMAKVINKSKEIEFLSVGKKTLSALLVERVNELEKK
jgi:hypothetical protein